MLPVSSPTFIPAGDSRADRERKCCSARISVGAIMALCQPLCQASQAQAAATAVLPEPTSPWTSRFMGRPEAMSAAASSTVRRWAPVKEKGSRDKNGAKSRLSTAGPAPRSRPVRSRAMPQERRKNSSKISRRRAISSASQLSGKWMFRQENSTWARLWARRTSSGSSSGTCPAHSSTHRRASPASRLLEMPAVRG